jgi:hypothetical protein
MLCLSADKHLNLQVVVKLVFLNVFACDGDNV